MRKVKNKISVIIALALGMTALNTAEAILENTVFERAGNKHHIDPVLLYAVALAESGYSRDVSSGKIAPHPYAIRSDHAIYPATLEEAKIRMEEELLYSDNLDLGMMQINTRWHRNLFNSYEELLDPETNADLGAGILSRLLADTRYREMEVKIGHYHSFSDEKAIRSYGRYVMQIYRNLKNLSADQISSLVFEEPWIDEEKIKKTASSDKSRAEPGSDSAAGIDQNGEQPVKKQQEPNENKSEKPADAGAPVDADSDPAVRMENDSSHGSVLNSERDQLFSPAESSVSDRPNKDTVPGSEKIESSSSLPSDESDTENGTFSPADFDEKTVRMQGSAEVLTGSQEPEKASGHHGFISSDGETVEKKSQSVDISDSAEKSEVNEGNDGNSGGFSENSLTDNERRNGKDADAGDPASDIPADKNFPGDAGDNVNNREKTEKDRESDHGNDNSVPVNDPGFYLKELRARLVND